MKLITLFICLFCTTGLLAKKRKYRKKRPKKPAVTVNVSAGCCNDAAYPKKNMENGCEDEALTEALRAQGKKLGDMKLLSVKCYRSEKKCVHDDAAGYIRMCDGKVGK